MRIQKALFFKPQQIVALLFAFFFITPQVFAQKSAKSSKDDTSLLWKIEGKDLAQPSYLFGTVHMICEDNFIMPEKVKSAIAKTGQTYLEINMAAPDFAQQAQKYMMRKTPLSAEISKEDFVFVDSIVKEKLKVNLKQYENLKPGILLAFIMQASFTCKIVSFESEVIKLTKAGNKNIDGLSTVDEQYSFLDKIFETKDLIPYLKKYDDKEMSKMTSEIAAAYGREDLTKIDEMMLEFSSSNPEGYRQLLPVRNHLWADKMPGIMKNKPTFFAIGCGHLLGKEGVVGLLRAQGYKVTPVH